jgi:truncated hemoglobin YjbI
MECPFTDLEKALNASVIENQCPFHKHVVPDSYHILTDVPLRVKNGSHQVSDGTARLLKDIGGGDRIRELCTRFYARAFLDQTLTGFFFADDGATAHGQRLADWIIQKMGGEGEPWTDSGRWGMRQVSHRSAWNSVKRDESVRGRHFKLGETRVWMRLHFWAVRECGLDRHAAFWRWYIQFIAHFAAVYDAKAPQYAAVDAEWSASDENLRNYEDIQARYMRNIANQT